MTSSTSPSGLARIHTGDHCMEEHGSSPQADGGDCRTEAQEGGERACSDRQDDCVFDKLCRLFWL